MLLLKSFVRSFKETDDTAFFVVVAVAVAVVIGYIYG
jgi:hypothetical protein